MTSGTRRNKKRAFQRLEILTAARELLLSRGHGGFSMRKLAERLDCSPGMLYLYFDSKHELLAELVEESFEHLLDAIEGPAENQDRLLALKGIMRSYIDFGVHNPDLYHFAFMLRRTEELDRARPRPHRSYDLLRTTIAECIERGLLKSIDPTLATNGVWSAIHGITALIVTMPSFPWPDSDVVVEHVIESTVASLLPEPGGSS